MEPNKITCYKIKSAKYNWYSFTELERHTEKHISDLRNTYKEKPGLPSVIRDTIRPVSVSLSDTTFCKNVYMKKPKTLTSH